MSPLTSLLILAVILLVWFAFSSEERFIAVLSSIGLIVVFWWFLHDGGLLDTGGWLLDRSGR
jgi:hypothetical protein